MTDLNIRHKNLIKTMLNEKDYKPMRYYSGILNISPRTLYSDINAINCFIEKFEMLVDRKPGLGIKLTGNPEKMTELLHYLNYNSKGETTLSPKERQLEIGRLLIVKEETLNYQKLSDYFLVSRTSIAKDMDKISSFLNHETVYIESDKKGTRIVGTETQKQYSLRKFINLLLEENK